MQSLTTNKIMLLIGIAGILLLINDQVWDVYVWAPESVKVISLMGSIFIVLAGFFCWKPALFILVCISPWLFYQGIISVFFDSSQVLFHAPVFFKKYFYILYAIGVTSGILCIFLAVMTFIGLIFWRKESLQKKL